MQWRGKETTFLRAVPRRRAAALTLHPLPRCSHAPLCPDSTTPSAEKRRGRRAGSAHRAGRLSRRVMAMTIRAEIRRSVGRGDEGRRPRVAVALGLLGRPRRTGQSGRGGARGRRVTLFQPRCWFGMSARFSWPVSAARGGSDCIGMLPRAPAAAPLSRRTGHRVPPALLLFRSWAHARSLPS